MTAILSRLIVKAGPAFNIIIMNFVSSHGYSENDESLYIECSQKLFRIWQNFIKLYHIHGNLSFDY